MTPLFESMAKAIQAGDEALFKAQWHPQGFETNLTGSSGLSGREVFEQGSRKKWFLKPDLAKAVDRVYIRVADGLVLGGGENLDEVRRLRR